MLQHQSTIRQIGYLHTSILLQIYRAEFTVRSIEVGIAFVFNLRQFVPVGTTKITGKGIKCTRMGSAFVLCKAQKSLKGSGSDTYSRLALNIE